MVDPKDLPDDDAPDDDVQETQGDEDPDAVDDDGADGTGRDDEPKDDDGAGDDGKGDDEPDDDDPETLEVQPDELQGLKPNTRAYNRVKVALERAKAAEKERDEVRSQTATRAAADSAAAIAAEEKRLDEVEASLKTEAERVQFRMAREIKKTQASVQALAANNFDVADRADFRAKYSNHPRFSKFVDDVEKRYESLKGRGVSFPREAVMAYVLGERLLKNGGKAAVQQKRKAAKRIDRERGRASSTRSNASGGRERGSLVNRAERDDWAI